MKRLILLTSTLLCLAFSAMQATAGVSLSLSPQNAQVPVGGQLQFVVTVQGTSDSVVTWSVEGTGCSGITCGMISAEGLYAAPTKAPSPSTVTVTVTSLADVTATATSTLTIGSPSTVSVAVSPNQVVLAPRGQQQFKANVTGTSNTSVTWSISGIGCVGGSCGSITPAGLYTAPSSVPSVSAITITAVSVANPTKSGSASLVVQSASSVSVSVSPRKVQVASGGQLHFSATVTGSTNTAVVWSISGAGCSGVACGTITAAGLYTAPAILPAPPSVAVKATAMADPSASGSATVTLVAGASVSVSPPSVQLKPGAQAQFTVTVSGSSSTLVIWSISGSGCSGSACGSISASGLYTAPAKSPNPPIVAVTATLLSDPTKSGSATVTITSGSVVAISISPTTAQVGVGVQQQFSASVTGSTNTAVTWTITGIGCAGNTCGTVNSSGLFTAPVVPPNPSFLSVTATSVADPTKSASATVTIVPEVSITISPTSAKLRPSASQHFSVQVTGSSNTTVSWSISGTGCTGSSCGAITQAGLYTAPAIIPNPAVVKVTATSQADVSKSASAQVSIATPVSVKISPTTALITVGAQRQFQALVTGSSNLAVTWTVGGAGCTGSGCGTVSSSGLYTAPATVPNPANVRVTATAQADSSESASAAVTVAPSNNSKLNGQYAFLFKGFDRVGVYEAAASFIADGNGNVTSGIEDINRTSGPQTGLAISGSYQVGDDNRGTLTLNSKLGTSIYAFALNGTAKAGSLIESDNSGAVGSGVIKVQDATAFDPSVFSGGYAISLTGIDAEGARIAAIGSIFPSGVGTISGSSLDVNDAGDAMPTFATFSGTYSMNATGHGTLTFVIPGFDGGTFNFALYAISANEYFLVSIDPVSGGNPIFAGMLEAQTALPFLTSSFKGASIFDLTGSNGSFSQVTVGRMQFDGAGNIQVQFDQNSGGNITIAGVLTGAYSIQLNGRGVLTLDNEQTGARSVWILYATAPNQAFVLNSDGSVGSGDVNPQALAPPFETGDLQGNFEFGAGEPTSRQPTLLSGTVFFDGGSNLSGTEGKSQAGTFTGNLPLLGTYAISVVSNNGRGVAMLTSPATSTEALWVVSGLEVLGLDVGSANTAPTLLVFKQ
jgi:hypothetical protein